MTKILLPALLGVLMLLPSAASAKPPAEHGRMAKAKMVAYDAKDRRYYSVAWAKSHGMHDKGGDPLTIVPMASLPKDAKMSHAMHGRM